MFRVMVTRAGLALIVVGILAGCQTTPMTTTRLGEVNYDAAFAAGREVFGQYYTIETADAATGVITGVPKSVQPRPDRVLTSTAAREVAKLRLRRDDEGVWADVRVTVQRLDTTGYRNVEALHGARDLPRRTPAQDDAPLTPEQNEVWRAAGNNLQIEQRILIDLVQATKNKSE